MKLHSLDTLSILILLFVVNGDYIYINKDQRDSHTPKLSKRPIYW